MLDDQFFNRDAQAVAKALLGKVIHHHYKRQWLSAQIIETEAYYLHDKASHASLGFTEKRKALFMPPGTIYMYYARGGDSFNVSCKGKGNAVLIKSAIPYVTDSTPSSMLETMHRLNPLPLGRQRKAEKLCAGQTLLCRALQLRVPVWDQKQFDERVFYIEDVGINVVHMIATTRCGIPEGRDEHLPYRFIDVAYLKSCTKKPGAPG